MKADDTLAQNWATIWQSELSALATDRELHEAFSRGAAQLAPLLATFWALQSAGPDGPPGRAEAAAPPGTAAVGDARDALERRVADLERQLAQRT